MKLGRKIGLIICVLLAACVVMASCGGGGGEAPKQELTIALDQDIGGHGPGSGGVHGGLGLLTFLVYDGLVEADTNFNNIPGLAESWEMSADGRTWTFHLREGVKFNDGTTFDAEDVKFTYEWFQAQGPLFSSLSAIEEIVCLDDYTVQFNLSRPGYTLASDLCMQENPVISTTAVDEDGNLVKAVGTGPFKVEQWVKAEKVVLVRNEECWRGTPKLEKITFRIVPDPEIRAIALEAGEIDLMRCEHGALTVVSRLKENRDLKVFSGLSSNTDLIWLKTQEEPFNDVRVRKALNYAIDVNGLVTVLLTDVALPAEHVLSPGFGDFVNPDATSYGYDPDEARRLLANAGWEDTDGDGTLHRDGASFEVTLTYNAWSMEHSLMAQAIQAQLAEVGIDVSLEPVEYSVCTNALFSGDFEMFLFTEWYIPVPDPSSFYRPYFHSHGMFRMFTNETLDPLIDSLDITLDEEERLELHYQIQDEIMDNAPVVLLYHDLRNVAMKESVQDFEVYTGYWQLLQSLEKVYISE